MFGCRTDNKKIMRRFENKNNAIGDSSAIFISLPLHSSFFPSLVHTSLGSSLVFSPFSHRSSFTSFTQLCLNILMLVDLLDV